jgi:hypothetical protein
MLEFLKTKGLFNTRDNAILFKNITDSIIHSEPISKLEEIINYNEYDS